MLPSIVVCKNLLNTILKLLSETPTYLPLSSSYSLISRESDSTIMSVHLSLTKTCSHSLKSIIEHFHSSPPPTSPPSPPPFSSTSSPPTSSLIPTSSSSSLPPSSPPLHPYNQPFLQLYQRLYVLIEIFWISQKILD